MWRLVRRERQDFSARRLARSPTFSVMLCEGPGLTGWRTDQIAMALLIAALLAVVMVSYAKYGFTTDEARGVARARRVYAFLSSVGRDSRIAEFELPNYYGAAPDVLALLLQKLVPRLSFDARHLVFASFGVVGILFVYKFGRAFVSPWTGCFAALFLATTPMWFGYMFFNHKDIPFAAMLIASSYYSLVALTAPATRLLWLKLGVTIGLLATIKIVGIPILGFVVVVFLGCFMMLPGEHRVALNRAFVHRAAAVSAAALGGILVCSLLFWPQLYLFRPDQVFRVVTTFLNFEQFNQTVLIFQTVYEADKVPWYYGSGYFLISTPLYLLALAGAGLVCAIYKRAPPIIASAIVFLFAFAEQAIAGARIYDGCRHFLFVYPFFMLLAAYPVALILDAVKHQAIWVALIGGAIGFCVSATIVEMYRLFPYQYSFYNSLVGGFEGADGKFYIDVWLSAEREALDEIEILSRGENKVRIFSPPGPKLLNIRMHPRFVRVKHQEDADYIVALRHICATDALHPVDEFDGLPAVGKVHREGVLLAKIYAVRPRG